MTKKWTGPTVEQARRSAGLLDAPVYCRFCGKALPPLGQREYNSYCNWHCYHDAFRAHPRRVGGIR